MNEIVKKAWAELAALYGAFSTTAQIITRRKYPDGDIVIEEFDFDNATIVATIFYHQDYDSLRITLDELAQEFEKVKGA